MNEKEFLKKMSMGMATQYSKLIKASVYKYITENKRTETPILNNLKHLITAFEIQVLGNMSMTTMYCIHDLEVDVDNLKVHILHLDIDNSDLKDIKCKITKKSTLEFKMQKFNKNWILFVQKFNKDFPNSEERLQIDANLFLMETEEQFKELKKINR